MITFLYFLLCIRLASCYYITDESEKSSKDKIIGGRNIDIKLAPYTAQIVKNGVVKCGGSIIAREWILTAAHCFEGLKSRNTSVITGTSRHGRGEKHRLVAIHLHRYYNNRTQDNDIALVKLMRPMTFNESQKPIEISASLAKTGDKVRISGFGKTNESVDSYSDELKGAVVKVVDQLTCRKKYAKYIEITNNMFCAAKNGSDSCQGDSGGPAVIHGKLTGIVSFGKKCASRIFPGIYTQVYKYREWIAAKTGLQL